VSEPTTGFRGYVDDSAAWTLDGYSAAVDYLLEQVPELTWPSSIRMYARMRHDPQLAAVLKGYTHPIRKAHWAVDGAGCRDEVTARIADDLGLPVAGVDEPPSGARRRRFTFAEHLRVALLDQVFGHMFFEQNWAADGGRWRLDQVAERMPQTVGALKLNRDGTLAAVVQGAVTGVPGTVGGPTITTADHRLVYYTREREGSNYFGQSLLRPSYGPWLIKDQMLRVHATSIRRFGMGVPTAQALPGTSPTPQQMAEAQRVVAGIKAGENSGVSMPPGFRLALEGLTGTAPDTVAFINLLDRYMTRSTLTSILDMATAERGNRSLGETVMDLMIMAQQDAADFHAEAATAQLVVPLVDANWGEDEPAPRIVVDNVGADVETTAQDIYWLMAYGGLKPDAPARAWIRQLRNIPPEDPGDPVFAQTPPNPAQPDPNTPATNTTTGASDA